MRYLVKVRYDGSHYEGWQSQPNKNTIEDNIEEVFSKLLNNNIKIYGSGRTDAGVHALGQTFHFDSKKEIDKGKFLYSANSLLPEEIKLISIDEIDNNFHARLSVKRKEYIYKINMGDFNPFTRDFEYQLCQNLDLKLMEEAANLFIGEHNFQDFTSKPEDEWNFIREIYSINFELDNKTLNIKFTGNGFMKYMIRFLVGTLVEIGLNKVDKSFIQNHIDSKERKIISYKVPGNGLYLSRVIY